ncbi:ATP-binding cassette subfamily B protein [Natranaerovirga pectinivora]|uniref:ATP-binding cassette subfamily B protein n=1 Tax=Natranaerovirga pectinivora TaxID=682400 RepID=A0A4R3MGZ8_9FIRM|nr:ABC transporter ATP-binding protein [Natranaerovirga pectinivora]TCT11637.1 ATP-binding cassette subfamily B protein [Natranaerovirga pectinivora]
MSNKEGNNTQKQGGVSMRPGGMGNRMLGAPQKAKDTWGTVKRIGTYMMYYKFKLLGVLIMIVFSSLFTIIGPYLLGLAVDEYIIPMDFKGLTLISLLMIVVYLLASFFTWLQNKLMIEVSQQTVTRMRKDLFGKIQKLPLKYFDSRPHGELMSRLTNDVENVSSTLSNSTTQVFSSVIILVGTIIAMLLLSPILTLISLIIIPLMIISSNQITKRTRKFFKEQQKSLGELNGLIEESISGQKVIKTFAREEHILKEFDVYNEKFRYASIRAQIYTGLIFPLLNVLNNISFAIVAGAGGYLAARDVISVGLILTFINYIKQFTRPVNELANEFNMVLSAVAGAERVFEVIDEEEEPLDIKNALPLENIKGKVDICNVDFSYNKGVPILKGVDLKVEPGQMIALVGPTGAGKTTIINLLTRFYDVDSGTIKIDDYNINDVKRRSLRSSLGIVLQDTYLFSESVKENIRYGKLDATDEEVEEAAKLANAHQFIVRLSDGYDTVLGEDGGGLSQGQRQLLAIARVILSDPSILILDEATSSVDTRTEIHIQEAMMKLMQGRTSFVIAHRLSTIQKADLIVVINDGQIIEKGTHSELLDKKEYYYELYMTQFNKLKEISNL